ncbi:protein-glutamate methylesterase/protein-glutamine glutaminase [Nocardioides pacificus]
MAHISVLVVDDSVVVRRLVTDVLNAADDIEVVGVAANGKIALAKMPQLNPDLITLDIEMPEMDGLETLRHLRRDYPGTPVIMFSTLTERGAQATLDALELGATDYVTKPANVGSVTASMASVRDQLVPRIMSLCGAKLRAAAPGAKARVPFPIRPTSPPGAPPVPDGPVDVLVIGVSTGGPDALAAVLPSLPASLPVPVLVVQHMPKTFTRLLAQRLDTKCALSVSEAREGDLVEPGRILIAPGDWHMRLRRRGQVTSVTLDQGTPENFCRPAVDVLFRSAVQVYGANVLAAVLTGMGSDGAKGARAIREVGGQVVAQDEATSVVWGMPGAAVAAGAVSEVVALQAVASTLTRRVLAARPERVAR